MKHHGLTAREVEESRKKHGANTLTQIPPDPLWKKILEGFKDPMIMILLVALYRWYCSSCTRRSGSSRWAS